MAKSVITSLGVLLWCGLLAALLSLSYWQYTRGQAKAEQIKEFSEKRAPRQLSDELPQDRQRYQLYGHYNTSQQLLLDNKFHQHRFGYHVITPFWLPKQQAYILVNRGFIPGTGQRSQLPSLGDFPQPQSIVGRAITPKANRLITKRHLIDNPGQWPLVIEQIDFVMISKLLGARVLPWVIWLDSDQPAGYIRDWQLVTMPPERHFAYAFQWLCLALLWCYLTWQMSTRKLNKS